MKYLDYFKKMDTPNIRYVFIISVVLIVILSILFTSIRRLNTRKLKNNKILERWVKLQKNCATRKTWPNAIIEADELLDDVLKCKGYKGKTTGERLVAAQHDITSNDGVWFGHKLSKGIASKDVRTIKKQDVLDALAGIRQALKDLGALEP